MVLEEVLEQADFLTLEEKEVFLEVFQHRLIEAKRERIYKNYLEAKKNYKKGKLSFTSDIEEAKKMLEI